MAYPYEDLGRELAAARLAAGIDRQSDLAARLDVTQQSVSRWEAGAARPRPRQISALAAALGVPADRLLALARYAGPLAVMSFDQPFPVDRLDPETFERFVAYLVALLHKEAKVDRAGGRGHAQAGLDVLATFPSGESFSFQCKRIQNFGPAAVEKMVRAHTAAADKKVLVISRIASPQAQAALRAHPGWELWDKETLSQRIRLELTLDEQARLVDIFFAGQRLALLGRADDSPWQTAEAFFAPYRGREGAFNHDWPLKGRDVEIDALVTALRKSADPVVLLTGPGGIGKSRLLMELSRHLAAAEPRTALYFLAPDYEATTRGLDALGAGRKYLFVDDAHDREGLAKLFAYVADPANKTRLLLASRPYAEARILQEAAVFGLGKLAPMRLEHLPDAEMEALVADVLDHYGGDPAWAADLVDGMRDSPLVAVMTARVIARERFAPELVRNDEETRRTILGKYRRVLTGDLGTAADQRLIQGALDVLALLQPFHAEDPLLLEVLAKVQGMSAADATRVLKLLVDGGIVYRRGFHCRLMPDLLGDYIVETSCLALGDALSPFAEQVFDVTPMPLLGHVLVNLGRLDWRRSAGDPSGSRLLRNIWRQLDDIDSEHDPRLEAVRAVAIYQPAQALEFVQRQFVGNTSIGPWRSQALSQALRNVAYNLDYLEGACELLWELGRDDSRGLGQTPSHPIRLLSELCGFEERKPVVFTERVLAFGLKLLDRDDVWTSVYSPFDIVASVLSGEGMTTSAEGRHIRMSPFLVDYNRVSTFRGALIDRMLAMLDHPDPRVGRRAAKVLDQALHPPIGMMNLAIPDDVRRRYAKEFAATLKRVRTVVSSGTLHPVVAVAIARAISWHAHHGAGAPKAAAQAVFEAMPTDLGFRTYAALIDGWGQTFNGRLQQSNWQTNLERWLGGLVADLRLAHPQPAARLAFVDAVLVDLTAALESRDSAHVLIAKLLSDDEALCQELVKTALQSPEAPIGAYAGNALGELVRTRPEVGRAWVRKAYAAGDPHLARSAAISFAGLQREVTAEDLALVEQGLRSEDETVLVAAVRALRSLDKVPARSRIELFKLVRFGEASWVAEEVAMSLVGLNHELVYTLDRADARQLLGGLEDVESFGHWMQELLVYLSPRFPHELADLFFARVERAAGPETFNKLRPVNTGPYAQRRLRITASPEAADVLSKTWNWLSQNAERDFYFQHHAAEVFEAMFLAGGELTAMFALFEARLDSAAASELRLMARVLRQAHHSFVFTSRPFVTRFLDRCRNVDTEALQAALGGLYASAISGIREGVMGEPMARDLKMRDDASEALRQTSRLSPAWRLYEEIRMSAERDIEQSRRTGAALDDR